MDEKWVIVWTGDIGEADIIRGILEAEGIPVYQPSASTKIVDPFITGGNALGAEVRVPESAAQRATERIEATAEDLDFSGVFPDDPDDEEEEAGEPEVAEDDEDDFLQLATRFRWAVLFGICVWPVWVYTVYVGAFYFAAVREEGRRPPKHGLMVAGYWVAVVLGLFVTFIVFGNIFGDS